MESIGWIFLVAHGFTGVLIVLLCRPLIRREVKPNKWYGFRIPMAYRSDADWYRVNEVGGRHMALAGWVLVAVGCIAPFLDYGSEEQMNGWVLWPVACADLILLGAVLTAIVVLKKEGPQDDEA